MQVASRTWVTLRPRRCVQNGPPKHKTDLRSLKLNVKCGGILKFTNTKRGFHCIPLSQTRRLQDRVHYAKAASKITPGCALNHLHRHIYLQHYCKLNEGADKLHSGSISSNLYLQNASHMFVQGRWVLRRVSEIPILT
jgi:hypothetical protein